VSDLVLVELLTMAVVFVDADKVLQNGLAMRDGCFDTADFFFQFADALFHLLSAETSCYRYWGEGIWTAYGTELSRRAIDIVSYADQPPKEPA